MKGQIMQMKKLKFKIVGVSPLLMHNGQTADPQNEWSRRIKEISKRRNKTDADYDALAKLEWQAGLYLSDGKPCIPGEVMEAALAEGAKKLRLGKSAKAGLWCETDALLEYKGPKDVAKLWANGTFSLTIGVRVQRNKVMRTRPRFQEWAATVEVQYDPDIFDEGQVRQIVEITGGVGLMDWRPKFGRYETKAA